MTRKIYKRIGLRRDKNFGDLSDARSALNNLLDGLVTDDNESFVSEDLEPIRNISNIGLTAGQYQEVVGSTTKYTPSNGGTNLSFVPHITFQNRIDTFTVFSGEPRLSGGNGLSASYWQKDQILVNSENSSDDTEKKFDYNQDTNSYASEVLAGITTFGQLPADNQWERGNFDYTGKIHPQSVLTDGGVTWEGYFVPTLTGPHTFTVDTSGYITFDFNKDGYEEDNDKVQTQASVLAVGAGNTYTEWARVGVTTTILGSANASTNTITIAADKSKNIGIGMSVSGTGMLSSGNIHPTVDSYEHKLDGTTTIVTLSPVTGQEFSVGVSGVSADTPLTFSRNVGDQLRISQTTQYLIKRRKYRFRMRFFFPKDINTGYLRRYLNIDYNMPGQINQDLLFYRLYSLDYSFNDASKGNFNRFLDAAVRFGGTNPIGIGGTVEEAIANPFIDNNSYVKVRTSDKVQAKYTPKTTLSAITRRTGVECISTVGGTVLQCGSTGSIEVGNYVFGPNTDESTNLVEEGSRVIEIVVNNTIVLDKPAKLEATQNLKFIDHRGFVKRIKGAASASGGSTVDFATGYKTDDTDMWEEKLKAGMIVLTTPQSGSDVPSYTRITSITDSDTIVLSNGMSNAANTELYIYQSRGLVDNSLITFCPQTPDATPAGHITRCKVLDSTAFAFSPEGTPKNEIPLVNISGLSIGLVVEGFGIPANTTITGFDGNTIQLSNNLGNDIAGGATVTIHESTLTGDRQLCCPPTDTSPPFVATPRGLITPDVFKHLSFTQGNVKFDELRFKLPNTLNNETITSNDGKIKKISDTDSIDRKIHIKTGSTQEQSNGLFYLLGTTVT